MGFYRRYWPILLAATGVILFVGGLLIERRIGKSSLAIFVGLSGAWAFYVAVDTIWARWAASRRHKEYSPVSIFLIGSVCLLCGLAAGDSVLTAWQTGHLQVPVRRFGDDFDVFRDVNRSRFFFYFIITVIVAVGGFILGLVFIFMSFRRRKTKS